jgi:hypothetical protein
LIGLEELVQTPQSLGDVHVLALTKGLRKPADAKTDTEPMHTIEISDKATKR